MGFWELLMQALIENPVLLGALLAIIRNVGGYITHLASTKKLEPWEPLKFVETLLLYETFINLLLLVPGMPTTWATALTVLIDQIRALKNSLSKK